MTDQLDLFAAPAPGDAKLDEAVGVLSEFSIERIINREVSIDAALKLAEFHNGKRVFQKRGFRLTEPVRELRKLKCIAVRYEDKTVSVRINRDVVIELARQTDLRLQTWVAQEDGTACHMAHRYMYVPEAA